MTSYELTFASGEEIASGRVFRLRLMLLVLICTLAACFVTGAWGAIPEAERTVLLNLYTSANGAGWTNSSGWNGGAGTECGWYGVGCDYGQNHVLSINLSSNNLSGTLPAIHNLTSLQVFNVGSNNLTGSIPSLTGLANLQYFIVKSNQLEGSIPSLSGLTNLRTFDICSNQLTGSIPDLTGLTNLATFYICNNDLTGSIPPLSGLAYLDTFYAYGNELSGPIPPLGGLTRLRIFEADGMHLTGSIPSLTGLVNLQSFYVSGNQLTGSIPSLGGLANLQIFYVGHNQLTGSIPSLSSLTNLLFFRVDYNFLTGDIPSVPNPNNLVDGASQLCPNYLNQTINAAWDAATGNTPWYQNCTAPPPTYSVIYEGNGNTGGSVPVDGNVYFSGQLVTVLGNAGALYESGDSFVGWNTEANGSGTSYVGGNTFVMGPADMILYAQWTAASGSPVRILETLEEYPDIQSAYDAALNGQTIEAQDGLGNQISLLFDNPNNHDPFSVKLIGGYNASNPPFTTDTGATLVIGSIEISKGGLEIENIIIQ